MGAGKKSSFCGILKACFSSGRRCREYEYYEDNSSGKRIFASDEDRGRWVAEPGIDDRASAFIATFYATRVSVTGPHQQYAS